LTKSFVVLIIGNSKSFHLGAQGTFNPRARSFTSFTPPRTLPLLGEIGSRRARPFTPPRTLPLSGERSLGAVCAVGHVGCCVCVCVGGGGWGVWCGGLKLFFSTPPPPPPPTLRKIFFNFYFFISNINLFNFFFFYFLFF